MSDEQERDAAFAQLEFNVKELRDALLRLQMDWQIYAGGVNKAIDRLTAERDAARAEVKRLRAACGGVADGIERTATHGVENLTKRDWLLQTAKNIRAALESEGGE